MTAVQTVQEERGFFRIDGVRLEFARHTPLEPGPTSLVLLHEGLGCVAMWKDFPRQLAAESGCRVLSYSRAGYGGSDPCPLPRPLNFMHDEGLRVLPQLLNAAEIERTFLVGHSDGASIALINAGGAADPRVQGLALMAPHVFVEELTLTSIRAANNAYRSTDLRARLQRYHGDNVACAFPGWNQAWLDPGFVNWNLETYLPQIRVPVLLIQGLEDNYGTSQQLERITAGLPQAPTVCWLSACGHSPFRDQPTETLEAITSFVTNHQQTTI
jgi:pimeloyl-ACP methyl ester carboxylesterase